jgi:hypothetical protein
MNNYKLLISFDGLYPTMAEEHAFVHGYEAGGINARLIAGETPFDTTVHEENRSVLQRSADARGYTVAFTPLGDGWLGASFERMPRRGHLAIVPGTTP